MPGPGPPLPGSVHSVRSALNAYCSLPRLQSRILSAVCVSPATEQLNPTFELSRGSRRRPDTVDTIEKLPLSEDRGQTDRATVPTRAGLRRCPGIGRATPHASPRYLATDYVTVETYYYRRQSSL